MKPSSAIPLAAGLLLLGVAVWWVPQPRSNPRPNLPEIAPFTSRDRLALVLPNRTEFPPADCLGLVQRARAAGAEICVFAPGDPTEAFAPTQTYQPSSDPGAPTGYHPDQWPALPPSEKGSENGWQMLVLTPAEMTRKNAAILQAARALRRGGSDDSQGTREAALLAHARRAELYRPLQQAE